MKKTSILCLLIGFSLLFMSFPQQGICQSDNTSAQNSGDEYVYLKVYNKFLSTKLNVDVDFGDEPDQLKKGEEFSKTLTGKKSFVAVLNYMLQQGYELVSTVEYTYTSQGSGGTVGLGYIMRKKKE
jgi:hypothetical protein